MANNSLSLLHVMSYGSSNKCNLRNEYECMKPTIIRINLIQSNTNQIKSYENFERITGDSLGYKDLKT